MIDDDSDGTSDTNEPDSSVSERRRFLYGLGAVGLASVAGCTGSGGDGPDASAGDGTAESGTGAPWGSDGPGSIPPKTDRTSSPTAR